MGYKSIVHPPFKEHPKPAKDSCIVLFSVRKARKPNKYIVTQELTKIDGKTALLLPLVIDTEFVSDRWQKSLQDIHFYLSPRRGVTTQIKGIWDDRPLILVHPDQAKLAKRTNRPLRHPVARSGFHPIDFLQHQGMDATIRRCDDRAYVGGLKGLQVCLYSFFSLAELLMVVDGDYRNDIKNGILQGHIKMQRRLAVSYQPGPIPLDWLPLPWIVTLNGFDYGVQLSIIDACALHGVVGYAGFCANAGIVLDFKNLMGSNITQMDEAYFERPIHFDRYALGDLEVYSAMKKNAENFQRVWSSLGVGDYYPGEPRLTIGKTVRDLFRSKIVKLFDIAPEDSRGQKQLIATVCHYGSAQYFKDKVHTTECLLSKVEGGRCRSGRPTDTNLTGPIVDIDLSGCYGSGQRNQLYPLGRPITIMYEESKQNAYNTLGQFLAKRKWGTKNCDLVPGLWHCRVSTNEGEYLEYPQDFLASWFGFHHKDIKDQAPDSDLVDLFATPLELNVKTGITKILKKQVINGLVTHDFVQWLDYICSPQQRRELLDKLYMHAAIYYPASDRVNSPQEVLERIATHKGKNTCETDNDQELSQRTRTEQECHAWYGVNIGELVIDDLIAWRKLHPKKTPMNTLYKLCINTLYGDMVSPYFDIGNVVVGNNITARARATVWYAEKGFHAVQSITDGGCFELNQVVYPVKDRRVTSQALMDLYREPRPAAKRKLRLAPLGGYEHISLSWDLSWRYDQDKRVVPVWEPVLQCDQDTYKGKAAYAWVDVTAMDHLRMLFPKVDVLHAPSTKLVSRPDEDGKPIKTFEPHIGQFEFEMKAFYDRGTFHGTANYRLENPSGVDVKMRSYEKKEHGTIVMEDDVLRIGTRYNTETPAKFFMNVLYTNPHRVVRGDVFIKDQILKTGDFTNRYESSWKHSPMMPGDTVYRIGLLREFSLSQFTFQTVAQYKAIERQSSRYRDRYGQYVEPFFQNEDGTLDYQTMVEVVDRLLSEGCMDLPKALDKHKHVFRKDGRTHPVKHIYEQAKQRLADALSHPEGYGRVKPQSLDELAEEAIATLALQDRLFSTEDD